MGALGSDADMKAPHDERTDKEAQGGAGGLWVGLRGEGKLEAVVLGVPCVGLVTKTIKV